MLENVTCPVRILNGSQEPLFEQSHNTPDYFTGHRCSTLSENLVVFDFSICCFSCQSKKSAGAVIQLIPCFSEMTQSISLRKQTSMFLLAGAG